MKTKLNVIRQNDTKDCGPCALLAIIKYYGGYVPLEKIRTDCFTSLKGTTVYHLVKAAESYGFDAVAKKILDTNFSDVILPAIVHVKYQNGLTHFMVLTRVKNDKFYLMDPAKGNVVLNKEDFVNIFTGIFIELFPKSKIVLLEKESSLYKLFGKIIMQNKKLCINLLICSFLLSIITIVCGFYFKVGYDEISMGNLSIWIIYLFFAFTLLKIILNTLRSYYENHLNKNIDINIFKDFITHVFSLPLNMLNKRTTGEIISRVNEISSIKDLFCEIFISCFLDLILGFSTLITLYLINNTLALIILLLLVIYLGITLLFSKYLNNRIRQNIDYQTKMNSILIENIDMIDSIKNLNITKKSLKNIENSICDFLYDNFTFKKFLNYYSFFKIFIMELGIFFINTIGFYLIYNNKLSLISLISFNTIMYYLIDPFKQIVDVLPKYHYLSSVFYKICDFLGIKEETMGKNEKFINGDIVFKDISYSYNKYDCILDNINFKIRKGDKVMIKGPSGCGKSTLCHLLTRIEEPLKGQILINEKNILDYSLNTIKNNIVYVGQKENIFTGTVKNNILIDKNDTTRFDKVCKICYIDEIIKNKPFRYDFGIENNNSNISGGEKQRIILARALMREASILVLDEALSETDMDLEKNIINNIIKEFPNLTLLYISHKKQDALFKKIIHLGSHHANVV